MGFSLLGLVLLKMSSNDIFYSVFGGINGISASGVKRCSAYVICSMTDDAQRLTETEVSRPTSWPKRLP